MIRSQTVEMYEALLEGKRVKVTLSTRKEFETIRTALHRHHRSVVDLGGSELSLLANFDGQEALFRLGTTRRKRNNFTFTIEEDDAQIQ